MMDINKTLCVIIYLRRFYVSFFYCVFKKIKIIEVCVIWLEVNPHPFVGVYKLNLLSKSSECYISGYRNECQMWMKPFFFFFFQPVAKL